MQKRIHLLICITIIITITVPLDSKETELGSSDQQASPSAGKNTGVVLVPCSRMDVRPSSYFRWWGYFWGPLVSFVTTDEFSVGFTKITSRIGVSWTHSLIWPYHQKHFQSRNSLKVSFTNIRGLHSNFVDCESFLESLSWHSRSVWDKPGWLNWFWQFLCERLSSFNPKGF